MTTRSAASQAMALYRELYRRSPVPLQNALQSCYGFTRGRMIRGATYRRYLSELERTEWLPKEALAHLQWRKVLAALRYANESIPYYQRRWREQGLEVSRIRTPEEFRRVLPILEKANLIGYERELIPTGLRSPVIELHTSGSTGSPFTVFVSSRDLQYHTAFVGRIRRWAGVTDRSRKAAFTGKILLDERDRDGIFWRSDWINHDTFFSSYHLTAEHAPRYVEQLNHLKPELIEGYPSAIYLLAKYIRDQNHTLTFSPKAVIVTAEAAHPFQLELMRSVFQTQVFDYYSSNEGVACISHCPAGNYHLHSESGFVEFINAQGEPAAPGELAEMIMTTVDREVMPLFRYRIRDLARLSQEPTCPCGRELPRIDEIVGRMDDMVYVPSRGWVGRLSQVAKVFDGTVTESQIIQEDLTRFVVKLVPRNPEQGVPEAQLDAMRADMKARLGDGITVEVQIEDAIPKNANGKFRYVLSRVAPDVDMHVNAP